MKRRRLRYLVYLNGIHPQYVHRRAFRDLWCCAPQTTQFNVVGGGRTRFIKSVQLLVRYEDA